MRSPLSAPVLCIQAVGVIGRRGAVGEAITISEWKDHNNDLDAVEPSYTINTRVSNAMSVIETGS